MEKKASAEKAVREIRRKTRRYARLSDEALVSVLRPDTTTAKDNDFSRTCPTASDYVSNDVIAKGKLASPTGVEPVLKRRKSAKSRGSDT